MSSELVKKEVLSFLRDHIESVEQLEILLLLFHRRDRCWSAEEVARELRSSAASAATRLAQFAHKGFLEVNEDSKLRYRYQPAEKEVGEQIMHLAAAYQTYRVTIIDLIFSKPIDKINVFANAFKIREDK